MCRAIAGRITKVEGEGLDRRAVVDVVGIERDISLALLPDASAGEWVIFHSGYAVRALAEEEAGALASILDGS